MPTVSAHVARTLAQHVDHVFGVMGNGNAWFLDALERSVWNQSNAAKLLGMPRRTLVKRLAQYDLPRPRKRES